MAIRLDEARLRLLKMCGELSPSINNTYNIGTSSLKFANVYATTFHGKLNGNANTATLLSLHNTMTSSSTRSVSASNWDGALSGVTYMWGQSFKDTSISSDTGDLVLAVRPSVYSSGNTELCMVIDGDYYSLTNKVLHAGNYTDYTVKKDGTGASGTWGINISGLADRATYITDNTNAFYSGASSSTLLIAKTNNITTWALERNGTYEQLAAHFYDSDGRWTSGYILLDSNNYNNYAPSLIGTGASGTWGINISGNATTAQYPAGFSSYASGVTWGNTIGTSIACWGDSTGGSVDWRRDNPSSGKISMKVDGRVYVNEGFNPVMGMNTSSGFWGMGDPDGNSSNWIRTTSSGIIPYSSGGASALGAKTWPFNTIWSKSQNIIDTYWPSFNLISQTANSKGTYSKGMVEVNYNDSIGMWIHSNEATDAKSRRALVLYGYGQKADASEAIALRQCDTSGTWLSDLYLLHSGNYNNYALPLSGGTLTGPLYLSNQNLSVYTIDNEPSITESYSYSHHALCLGYSGNDQVNWYEYGGIWNFYKSRQGTLTKLCHIDDSGIHGAVQNDYAEYRSQTEELKPGHVAYCDNDGRLKQTTSRLQKFEGVVSDTFGFAIGETEEAKTPLAVSGRVLVYTYEDRNTFNSGDCVCAGPNGRVCKMTREEIAYYPDRIVGIVSEIPEYDTWGTGNVDVDGRIWIKIR